MQLARKIASQSSMTLATGKRAFYTQREMPLSDAYLLAQGNALTTSMRKHAVYLWTLPMDFQWHLPCKSPPDVQSQLTNSAGRWGRHSACSAGAGSSLTQPKICPRDGEKLNGGEVYGTCSGSGRWPWPPARGTIAVLLGQTCYRNILSGHRQLCAAFQRFPKLHGKAKTGDGQGTSTLLTQKQHARRHITRGDRAKDKT